MTDPYRDVRRLLSINGAVFLLRAATNFLRPTSFWIDEGAGPEALAPVRALAVSYASFGMAQIGAAMAGERRSLVAASIASVFFAVATAIGAGTSTPRPEAPVHRLRLGVAVENAAVAALYGRVLSRAISASSNA